MTVIDDLSQCNYLPLPSEALRAVGWLSSDSVFERAAVSPEFYEKLSALCAQPWQPVAAAGKHYCQLCQFESPGFSSNVFVPYRSHIYVAPVAIIHYIAAHWYRPPDIFIHAVMECPPMNSMEYKKSLLDNGGRDLVKAAFGSGRP